MRGSGEDVVGGDLDKLRERPIVGKTKYPVLLARHPRIVPPVQRRVYDHLGPLVRTLRTIPAGHDLAGTIGARNLRKNIRRNPRILPLGGEKVPAVQRSRPQPDHGLPGIRLRLGHVFINELVWTFEFVQTNSFQGRSLRSLLALQLVSTSACQLSTDARPVLSREGFARHARLVARATRYPTSL